MIYSRNKAAKPGRSVVIVDGKIILRTQLPGASGEIRLPELKPGVHNLQINTDPGLSLYVSHSTKPDHVKRYVQRIKPGKVLTYHITKGKTSEPQLLSGRIYTPARKQNTINST